jgi:hypothetical protein
VLVMPLVVLKPSCIKSTISAVTKHTIVDSVF